MAIIFITFVLPSVFLITAIVALAIARSIAYETFWASEWNKAAVGAISASAGMILIGGAIYAVANVAQIPGLDLFAFIVLLMPGASLSLISAIAAMAISVTTHRQRKNASLRDDPTKMPALDSVNLSTDAVINYETVPPSEPFMHKMSHYASYYYCGLSGVSVVARFAYLIWSARHERTLDGYLTIALFSSFFLLVFGLWYCGALKIKWPTLLGIGLAISCIVADLTFCLADEALFR